VFNELYDSVRDGKETKRSLEYNGAPDYREKFEKEMEEIRSLEIWRAGKAVRYGIPPDNLEDLLLTCGTDLSDPRTSKGIWCLACCSILHGVSSQKLSMYRTAWHIL